MRPVLTKRFDMATWFRRQGFPMDKILKAAADSLEQERAAQCRPTTSAPGLLLGDPWPTTPPPAHPALADQVAAAHTPPLLSSLPCDPHCVSSSCCSAPAAPAPCATPHHHAVGSRQPAVQASKRYLLLMDFDKTLTDFDAGGWGGEGGGEEGENLDCACLLPLWSWRVFYVFGWGGQQPVVHVFSFFFSQ